ncbi:zinc-finger binding domain of transposase IS66 [Bradyrhizobium sp. Rc3b]|nr:zinc-finger binding domain of transposase IS66 [Bradyrhizobium sp. Rc3b]
MLLGLEDVEQAAAYTDAVQDETAPEGRAERARKRRVNRGALPLHLPQVEVVVDIDDKTCPCCKGELHRIAEDRSERLDMVPAQFRVVVTRRLKYACRACEDGVIASGGSGPADRGRTTDRSNRRPGSGVQICRSSAALPAGANLCAPGHRSRSIDARGLGGTCGLPSASAACAPSHSASREVQAVRRRDDGAGARSRSRAHQDRPALGLCRRRQALGSPRPARHRLRLCTRPQGRAAV